MATSLTSTNPNDTYGIPGISFLSNFVIITAEVKILLPENVGPWIYPGLIIVI